MPDIEPEPEFEGLRPVLMLVREMGISYCYDAIKRGTLPAVRRGGRWFTTREWIEDWRNGAYLGAKLRRGALGQRRKEKAA